MRSSERAMVLSTRWLTIGLLAFLLSACSRTVTWEEEVLLNTGETIWIERSMPWEIRGSQGNPFDLAMRPTRVQTIRFTYRSKEYTYVGRAAVRFVGISPMTGEPALVAPASSYAWDLENNFTCTVPHYVQLVPDATGTQWSWPEKVEPWLFDLPANVMVAIPALKETRKDRYTRTDITLRDQAILTRVPHYARIQRDYRENACLRSFGS